MVVAAGVPPAVEGWRLAARTTAKRSVAWSMAGAESAGRDARLYGRRDACHHNRGAIK
jgi:hypothetical protein